MGELVSRLPCDRYSRIKLGNSSVQFDRCSCLGKDVPDFVAKVDGLMGRGRILKKGDTSDVSCVTWHGTDLVVKRYNNRGLVHSLRHNIKASRACRSWRSGVELMSLGIHTPRPVAYIEQRKGPLLQKCYLITEYVKGCNLHVFLRDESITQEQKKTVLGNVAELLNRLGKARITHGDLKHTNILITQQGPVITDLDAMIVHRWQPFFEARRDKDIERFLRKTDVPDELNDYARSLFFRLLQYHRKASPDFDKVRISGGTLRIHRGLSKQEIANLVSKKDLPGYRQKHMVTVPSSEYTRVFKCRLTLDRSEAGFYLKQYLDRSVIDFIKHLVRPSRARRAFDASLMLRGYGFDSPRVAALFEKRLWPFGTDNFLLTEEVEDSMAVHEYLSRLAKGTGMDMLREKRSLIAAFGDTIGRLHAAGIFHGDLRLGNILVRRDARRWRFFLIDNERTKKLCYLPMTLRLKNLVQVNMYMDGLSRTDRLRFLKQYMRQNVVVRRKYKRIARKVAARTYRRIKGRHPHLLADT